MRAEIKSLESVTLYPDSDLEKLLLEKWSEAKVVNSGSCINNAGYSHPHRSVTITISFNDKKVSSSGGRKG